MGRKLLEEGENKAMGNLTSGGCHCTGRADLSMHKHESKNI